MTGKVIQGSFVGGQPKSSSVQPGTAPSPFQTRTAAAPPPAAFARRPPGAPPPAAFAARPPGPAPATVAARPPGPPAPAHAAQPSALQRHGTGGAFAVEAGALGLVSTGGRPLPDALRGTMEAALGADFSAVRVHVGPQAERIGAIAFTTGNDIYFAPGRYLPETTQGHQLLGHELAHVVQQRAGRVRNPLGPGLAIVQDRALEAEADRMGQRAATEASRRSVQRAVGTLPPGPSFRRGARSSVSRRQLFQRSPAIQRTIWQQKGGKWVEDELGTKGSHPMPAPEDGTDGWYFNDVNGTKHSNKDHVRAGLTDLMMITGSLNTLSKDATPFWPTALWNELMLLPSDLSFLGTIKITGDMKYWATPYTKSPKNSKELLEKLWNQVLYKFMVSNGQWNYIRKQPWFTEKRADIKIEVNFYKNRGYDTRLDFHKDTEGDNLFVNLLFNNQAEIPATEWIEDLDDPNQYKQDVMKYLMPDEMHQAITASRAGMKTGVHKPTDVGKIRGGKAPTAAFVSWVDELVWHATPSIDSRKEEFVNYYDVLRTESDQRQTYRGLARLSEKRGTQIANYRAEWKLKPTNQGKRKEQMYADYLAWLKGDSNRTLRQLEEVFLYKDFLVRSPISTKIGEDIADPLFGTPTGTLNTATGIKRKTERRNSMTILSPTDVNMGTRSFLRTWVRVVKREGVEWEASKV